MSDLIGAVGLGDPPPLLLTHVPKGAQGTRVLQTREHLRRYIWAQGGGQAHMSCIWKVVNHQSQTHAANLK